MIEVKTHPVGKDLGQYLYVVIAAWYIDRWVWVKHKQRESWEIPGGHIETGESADDAARRELIEETGATSFSINPVCDYTVRIDGKETIGRVYFANIKELGTLPESEIGCVDFFDEAPINLTYPKIQPILFEEVKRKNAIA